MKPIRCDLPRDLDTIELHAIADTHIGEHNCDIRLLKSRVAEIAEKPNAYCVLGGDLMNTATKTSVSDIYSEKIPPMEQIKTCVEIFAPISNKILCVIPGNHELRTYKTEGLDITALMAAQLGVLDKYSNTTALLFLRFGELGRTESKGTGLRRTVCYTVYVTHGGGGGRKEGGKVNRLADLASIIDADVYVHNHTHMPLVMKQSFFRTDMRNSTITAAEKLFVNTGACLDYGGYGDLQAFKPASKATPVIYLDGHKKEMVAML